MSAGAGPLRTFFWVTLPVLRPGILVGALFAFLHSFNEAVVAIFIAGRDASTLPKKMFEAIRLESDPVIEPGPMSSRVPSSAAPETPVADSTPGRSRAVHESAPAIGSIQELRDAMAAVARQWRREAEPLVGRLVLVYSTNFAEPESGTLARVTDDGLVLERDDIEIEMLWRLVAAIEPGPRGKAAAPPQSIAQTS